MAYTILSHLGYSVKKSSLDRAQLLQLQNDLYVVPECHPDYPSQKGFAVYESGPNWIRIPRAYGIETFGKPIVENLKEHWISDESCTFNGNLLQNQLVPFETTVAHMRKDRTGLLCLMTGSGKTVVSLAILGKLKQRACILIHKTHLLQQWKEEIATFLPNATVGIIQQTKKDFSQNCDIYLVMIQTLLNVQKVPDIFGTIIIDEVHHLPSSTFSRVLFKTHSKYILGLSATPDRKDGLTRVIHWHIGPTIFREEPNRQNQKKIQVCLHKFSSPTLRLNPRDRHSDLIESVINNKERNTFVLDIIKNLIRNDKNNHRRIVIFTERRIHATLLWGEVESMKTGRSCGLVLGQMKKEDMDVEKEKEIVFATFQSISEGISIKQLNTLILATPKKDIAQALGRIFRKVHTDVHPMIIDVVDSALGGKTNARMKTYKEQFKTNMVVHHIDSAETVLVNNGKTVSLFLDDDIKGLEEDKDNKNALLSFDISKDSDDEIDVAL